MTWSRSCEKPLMQTNDDRDHRRIYAPEGLYVCTSIHEHTYIYMDNTVTCIYIYIYIYIYIFPIHISVQRSQRNSVIRLTENISYDCIDLYHVLNTPVLSKFIVYYVQMKQGESEGFDSCDRPRGLAWPVSPWNWTNGLEKQLRLSSMPLSTFCVIS